jgi:uncharacterized protein (DUF427 family)
VENVWDYPRPPALVPCERRVRVHAGGELIADSTRALRVLETSHPPTIYVPPQDVRMDLLTPSGGRASFCEWKGRAHYYDVLDRARAAWAYADPVPAYAALRDHVAFYPSRMDLCLLGDEEVQAQPGDFYGGWLTADITGPVKGAPGTLGW